MASRFEGRTCVVTGAGKGIGRALIRAMAEQGMALVLAVTRSAEDCTELEAELGGASRRVVAIRADLGAREEVEAAMAAVERELRARGLPLNFLVNNAGIAKLEPLAEASWGTWDETMRVNAFAPLLCTQRAVDIMKRTAPPAGGAPRAIVNVSSIAALTALQDHCAYCMSKAALDMLTRVSALELAGSGVRCNAVNPTVVMTKMGREVWSGPRGEPMLRRHPMERFAEEGEVVEPVLFLLDERQSGFLNGVSLPIEGGLLSTSKV